MKAFNRALIAFLIDNLLSYYLLSIIYVSETTKQASPTTYEIQKEGSLYFIAPAPKQIYIDYDPVKDVLNLSSLGDYLRN